MRVEFNENGFSANIHENGYPHTDEYVLFRNGIKKQTALILAVVSLVIAALLLPFGLFMNIGTDLLAHLLGENLTHWTTVLLVLSFLLMAISVLCGVLAMVLARKAKQEGITLAVMMLAVFSFVLCAACLVLNILGLIIW